VSPSTCLGGALPLAPFYRPLGVMHKIWKEGGQGGGYRIVQEGRGITMRRYIDISLVN